MNAVCNRDCFNCPFPDCIVDEMDAEERKAHRDMEKDLMTDPEKKRIAAKQKAYYEANRDEIAAKQKAYYEANRDEIAAKRRAYREANRDEIAAKQKAYYEANRDENLRFGRALRQARKAHGLTQASLGRLLCVTAAAVSLWESGKCPAPSDKLLKILPELAEVEI